MPFAVEIARFPLRSDRGEVFRFCERDDALRTAVDLLRGACPSRARLFVVGGYLRRGVRAALGEALEPLGDLDVLVDCDEPLHLSPDELLSPVCRTPLGGYRWYAPGPFRYVDVWTVGEHYSVRAFRRPPTVESAMRGLPLNLDRALVDPLSGDVLDGGLVAGVRDRTIRYDASDRYLEHIQAVRAVSARDKTGYAFDVSVVDLFRLRLWRRPELWREIVAYLRANSVAPDDIERLGARLEAEASALAS